jgi:hypothetical protein
MTQPDPIVWIARTLINPETGKPFELLPAEIAFLQHAFELNEDGSARFPELLYSAPKKSGKTAFAAILTLTATLLYGGSNPEAICAANDLEQSQSRVFSAIKRIVRASAALRARARVTNREITFADIGATITAIASDAAGAAGGNAVISVGDELWGFVSEASRRLWDELVVPPTRPAGWRLVVTYAGFASESVLLEELYKHGIAQEQIGPDLYAGNGQLTFWTHRPIAPWQSDTWLAQMRRSLRPNQFARMIENRWVTSESAFIELGEWDRCVDPGLQPLQSDRNLPVFVGVDASTKRDSTAVVAVTTDGERVRLVSHAIFQPSPDKPLDFEATIEAEIVDLCSRFDVQEVKFDPWQMAAVSQRLMKRGAPMTEFAQTPSNLTDASSNLYELVKAGSLSVYPDEGMRLSISQAIAVETPRGWRIAKEKQRHKIDAVVALAQACHAAVKQQPIEFGGLLEHYRRKSEALNIGVAMTIPPTLMQEHADKPVLQIGTRPQRPAEWVKVIIPHESSQVCGLFASYVTEIENGQRIAWVDPRDAKVMLCTPAPSNLEVRESNRSLHDRLAADKTIPTEPAGTRAVDMAQAVSDGREARRPQTMAEEVAQFVGRKGAHANEILRDLGRRQ